jgi:LPXTG-motif cell wall-anchored protein
VDKRLALILIALLMLLPAMEAAAHKPLWGDGDLIEIPNLTTSFAAYRQLETADQVDTFLMETEGGETVRGSITIPQIEGLEGYGVRVAIFGPGLPEPDEEQLPADHPEDVGALVFPSRVSEDFFEPFTQTNYWGRQAFEVTLPEPGAYYLLVWQPEGEPGKYVLATGRAEQFAPTDFFRFPVWWVRVHIFFEHTGYLVLGGALLVGLSAGLLLWRRRQQQMPQT